MFRNLLLRMNRPKDSNYLHVQLEALNEPAIREEANFMGSHCSLNELEFFDRSVMQT